MIVAHVLDLPNVKTNPDADLLFRILNDLAPKKVKNFGSSSEDQPINQQSLFIWLTSLIACPLDWIDNDDTKEQIWDLTSVRLSERCGRTAAPELRREIDIVLNDNSRLEITLVEPSLTEDSLGLKTWGSALVVANRLAREHEQLLRDPVLELGSGTGLSGIVAAKLGHEIWVSDLQEIVDNLKTNVNLNCEGAENIHVQVLDWSNPSESVIYKEMKGKFKSILISDPIYSPQHPQMVCDMITTFLTVEKDALVCIQLPLREKYEEERDNFYNLLHSIGLERLRYEVEPGSDDFGEMEFAWSLWKWRA